MDLNATVFAKMMTTTLSLGISELDQIIDKQFQMVDASKDGEYLTLNLELAAHILCAVRNALITLSHSVHIDAVGNLEVRTTSTGIAGLLRIAFEGMATFKWLTEPTDAALLEARAFGIHFDQMSEARKYYRELGDNDAFVDFSKKLQLEVDYGLAAGYLKEQEDKPGRFKCVELAKIPDSTSLCFALKVPKEIVTEEIKKMYSGMANGAFLYRWLSGHTHGMYWVNSFEGTSEGRQKTKIVYWIMNLALETSLYEIRGLEKATRFLAAYPLFRPAFRRP